MSWMEPKLTPKGDRDALLGFFEVPPFEFHRIESWALNPLEQ